jgi:hypothetical protein
MKGVDNVAEALDHSTRGLWADIFRELNTKNHWKTLVSELLQEIAKEKKVYTYNISPWYELKGTKIHKGIYFGTKQANRRVGLKFYIFSPSKGDISNYFIGKIHEDVSERLWDKFAKGKRIKKKFKKLFATGPVSIDPDAISVPTRAQGYRTEKASTRFKREFKTAHDPNSTNAMRAVESMKKGEAPGSEKFTWQSTELFQAVNVADYIIDNVTADWKQTKVKKKLSKEIPKYNIEEVVTLNLGMNPILPDTDFAGLNKKGISFVRKQINKNIKDIPGREGSASIHDQIESDVTGAIVKNVAGRFIEAKTGRYVKVDFKAGKSKFSTKPRLEKNIVKAKKTKLSKSSISISIAGKKSKGPQPERGRKPKTQVSQEDLLKIERLINKRLPAEVRRNMGRPALINRTGRFSNSAEVSNFIETAAGVSGDYTYRLSPYETFENTGQRKWPAGYNPKPLIAKSIKSLYYQYKKEQLVNLRRK